MTYKQFNRDDGHPGTQWRRQPGFTVAPQKQSFDVVTGSFDNMFDDEPHMQRFILDSLTGSPVRDERGAY